MITQRAYLALAIPLIISTVTTPLLGAVDTAVVGHLEHPSYVGGVAVGAMIFNTLYWLFGFLRVSTSGFAAQASSMDNKEQLFFVLVRPLSIAVLVGAFFLVLQVPIANITLSLMNPEQAVKEEAAAYFFVRIWGAPFALISYVLLGWLMGIGKVRPFLTIQILMNCLNIVLALLFVHVLHWETAGVAAATLIAEVSSCLAATYLVVKHLPAAASIKQVKKALQASSLMQVMKVNADLFIRTICLLTVLNLFVKDGAAFGTEVLAANAILIQVHYMMAYLFDGFANASSILAGRAAGARDERAFRRTLTLSYQWSLLSAVCITALYFIYQTEILSLFTSIAEVQALTERYGDWLLLYPISAAVGLVLYGVFTGVTETKGVRNSMIAALFVYLLAAYFFTNYFHNDGLWLAFILFSLGRSVFLVVYVPGLVRKLYGDMGLREGRAEVVR